MSRSIRNSLRSWMFIYLGLIATIITAGQPSDAVRQDAALPMPAVVGSAPLLRKDI